MKQHFTMALALSLTLSPFSLSAQESKAVYEQMRHTGELSLLHSDSSLASAIGARNQGYVQPAQDVQQTQAYDQAPEAITIVDPIYPEAARLQKLEGTVWIKLWIDEGGKPDKISISRSDATIFDQAAIDAAMQWKFKPATIKGKPVGVWLAMPIRFKLPSSQVENREKPLQIKKSRTQEIVSLPQNHSIRIWIENGWVNAERKNANGQLIWRVPLFKASAAGLPSVTKQENTITIKDNEGRYFLKDEIAEFGFGLGLGTSLRVVRDPKGNIEKLQFKPSEYGLRYGGGMASSGSRYSIDWKANGWSLVSTGFTSGASVGLIVRLCYEDFAEDPGIHGTVSGSFFANRGNFKFYDDGSFLFAERMGDEFAIEKLKMITKLTSTEPPPLSVKRWYNTSGISLEDLKGKVVLLAFFDCRDPRAFEQLAKVSYLSKLFEGKSFAVLAIQLTVSEETIQRYLSKYPTELPIALDDGKTADLYKMMPDAVIKYHAEGPPSYFVIDKKGKLRKALLIGVPDKSYLEALLAE